MKDFYWWAKSILVLQKALTQIKKKKSVVPQESSAND